MSADIRDGMTEEQRAAWDRYQWAGFCNEWVMLGIAAAFLQSEECRLTFIEAAASDSEAKANLQWVLERMGTALFRAREKARNEMVKGGDK